MIERELKTMVPYHVLSIICVCVCRGVGYYPLTTRLLLCFYPVGKATKEIGGSEATLAEFTLSPRKEEKRNKKKQKNHLPPICYSHLAENIGTWNHHAAIPSTSLLFSYISLSPPIIPDEYILYMYSIQTRTPGLPCNRQNIEKY